VNYTQKLLRNFKKFCNSIRIFNINYICDGASQAKLDIRKLEPQRFNDRQSVLNSESSAVIFDVAFGRTAEEL
jgi:hypothetical protein